MGPVFAGLAESVQFHLETVGEDVVRAFPRLFYKYRGVEKLAEGRRVEDALLLAERFAATTAFAHALGFSRAAEELAHTAVPRRARVLRVVLAELERLRHHTGAIAGICESTGLVVAASEAAIVEEELLRLCGELTDHRYLFGLAVPGGLACDLADRDCRVAARRASDVVRRLTDLERHLRLASSFLDRLEDVGHISPSEAREHGLVGPGRARLRRRLGPAAGAAVRDLQRARLRGPGRAGGGRLRTLADPLRRDPGVARPPAAGAGEAARGSRALRLARLPGEALGWVEAPRGAAYHWLRLDDEGRVARYRVVPPSFVNWHGFHLAVERFAFQDFPIILATLGLSVAENDR